MQPTAIVLHGPTSAGKTTLAKALQATSPLPAFHISLDAFVCMSNRRDMRTDAERAQAYRLHCENLRTTLARVALTQFDIILDLVLRDEDELQACLKTLSARDTYVVGVSAPLHVLEERERSRDDRAIGMAREQVGDAVYRRRYDLLVDTSKMGPEHCAAVVRKLVSERSHDRSIQRITHLRRATLSPAHVRECPRGRYPRQITGSTHLAARAKAR